VSLRWAKNVIPLSLAAKNVIPKKLLGDIGPHLFNEPGVSSSPYFQCSDLEEMAGQHSAMKRTADPKWAGFYLDQ
jgi:hypothetical protein